MGKLTQKAAGSLSGRGATLLAAAAGGVIALKAARGLPKQLKATAAAVDDDARSLKQKALSVGALGARAVAVLGGAWLCQPAFASLVGVEGASVGALASHLRAHPGSTAALAGGATVSVGAAVGVPRQVTEFKETWNDPNATRGQKASGAAKLGARAALVAGGAVVAAHGAGQLRQQAGQAEQLTQATERPAAYEKSSPDASKSLKKDLAPAPGGTGETDAPEGGQSDRDPGAPSPEAGERQQAAEKVAETTGPGDTDSSKPREAHPDAPADANTTPGTHPSPSVDLDTGIAQATAKLTEDFEPNEWRKPEQLSWSEEVARLLPPRKSSLQTIETVRDGLQDAVEDLGGLSAQERFDALVDYAKHNFRDGFEPKFRFEETAAYTRLHQALVWPTTRHDDLPQLISGVARQLQRKSDIRELTNEGYRYVLWMVQNAPSDMAGKVRAALSVELANGLVEGNGKGTPKNVFRLQHVLGLLAPSVIAPE